MRCHVVIICVIVTAARLLDLLMALMAFYERARELVHERGTADASHHPSGLGGSLFVQVQRFRAAGSGAEMKQWD